MQTCLNRFSGFARLLAVVLALGVGHGWAQGGGTGGLTGIVSDPSGAIIPGAKVQLTNSATGAVRTVETSAAGTYRFVALPVVGTYTLKVEAGGFKTAIVANIVISVGRVVTQDIHLELGTVAETVTVEGAVQLVQTTESQISELVDRRVWQSLPLEFRNQNTFINLLPGVVPDDVGGTTRGAAVGGSRPGMGNFLVEGYDNNDQGQGGRGAIVSGAITSISPEAIQEYRILSHSYAAEYGKGGAFVTDTVLRSGTNAYHGSVFEYNRVQALAANSFFSNAEGVKDRLIRNQFGGSFGGPLLRDKTFFYASYEGHIRRQSDPVTATATTQAFLDFVRTGAFATFMESDPNGMCNNQTFLDNFLGDGSPGSGGTAAACPGAFSRSATLGPLFSSLLASQPFPLATSNFRNVGGGLFTDGIVYPVNIFGDVTVLRRDEFNENRISVKMDHKQGNNDTFSGTFLFEDSDSTNNIDGGDATIGPAILNPGRSVIVGLTHTHTFTPTMINQFRASYLRHRRDFPNVEGLEGVPAIVTAFDPLGVGFGNSSALPQFFTDNQFQYQDHLSVVRGKHTFKAGAEYRRTRNGSAFEANKNGLFLPYGIEEMATDGFFGDEADLALFDEPTFGAFFDAEASVNPVTGALPEYYRGFRANEVAGYFQDDWRVHPRLTINMGLRWEYFGPPHNFRPGLDSNFYFGSPLVPIPTTSTNPFFPSNSFLHARVAAGQFQQRDRNIWAKDTNNFGPRLGFAWDVFGTQKLILRGGGGVYYDRIWNNLFENIRFNPPFFAFASLGFFINGVPAGPLSTPGLFTVPFTSTSLFASFPTTPAPRHMDQDLLTAYNEQFNLGAQWEFLKNFVLEVNGVGTLGRKLHGVIDVNTFNGRVRGGNSTRPNPTIAGDNFRTNAFTSNSYGLQTAVRKSFSHGLQFNANYTWSHTIDVVSDAFNNGRGTSLRPVNNFDLRRDRGNAQFDLRHRFVISYYYELPWMKENRLVGGWSISGITTLQTGVPIPLFDSSSRDANADGYRTDRPVFLGTGNINDVVLHNQSPADGYFDTSQFRRVASDGSDCVNGVNGVFISATRWWCDSPLGRNTLIGPGNANFDLSVAKKIKITEALTLQFQASFFNLFNRPNFTTPSGNINPANPAFGQSQDTFPPRITQLALRLDF